MKRAMQQLIGSIKKHVEDRREMRDDLRPSRLMEQRHEEKRANLIGALDSLQKTLSSSGKVR